jgi:glycosyltransferase involved in cell wall biosynthesis
MPDSPPLRFSIVTPCLNSALFISEAIESVVNQGYPDVEHIVVDGGSTDPTLARLARFPHLRILTGPDRGMYDAINKGLSIARGDVIGLLNADDCYAEGALARIAAAFADPEVMAVSGEAVSFRVAGEEGLPTARFALSKGLTFHATVGNPAINAWFFRKSVFERIGVFDPSYRLAGDREWMVRLACHGLHSASIPDLVYRYRVHAGSATFAGSDSLAHTVMHEHAAMTARYLRNKKLPREIRALLRKAGTRDTVQAAMYALRHRQWRHFAFYARAGVSHDGLWPLKLLRRVAAGGLGS